MVSQHEDRFDRTDGALGSDYLIACGNATIFDGAVLPVTDGSGNSGMSPQLEGQTDEKTQVLFVAESMDSRNYVARAVWSHDPEILGERPLSELPTLTTTDPSVTILVRMTKDPMLVELGRAQDPACYDQGYGVRITCPRSGALPVMKLVKLMPPARPPGVARPSSTEPDGAVVIASKTLTASDLILDPDWDETGDAPYRGFFQETRIRVRRSDDRVILEVFHNDRSMNSPILEHTDQQQPAWGDVGVPGFEFLSPQLVTQPVGVSPFELAALPIMRVHIFGVQTIKDFHRPSVVIPSNQWTYDRVVDRVILLVEKNGDARYTATGSGTKRDTYLGFVIETENHIMREVGYYPWSAREQNVFLRDEVETYDLPADLNTLNFIRPSWDAMPLEEVQDRFFARSLAGVQRSGGRPRAFRMVGESMDDRPRIAVYPTPVIDPTGATADDHLIVEYFARAIYPSEPDMQLPLVPQHHMDVLTYGSAAHALLLDQDSANAQMFARTFATKLAGLKRDAHRIVSKPEAMRSAADVSLPVTKSRIPILRATQLENFLP